MIGGAKVIIFLERELKIKEFFLAFCSLIRTFATDL